MNNNCYSKNYNDIYNIVGKNIKKYRRKKKITQQELADLCYLSVGYISDLESNTFRTISLNTLYLIADKLDIHISLLLQDVEEEEKCPN